MAPTFGCSLIATRELAEQWQRWPSHNMARETEDRHHGHGLLG
ncbi:MAG: hypothetical protein ACJAQ9_001216 [Ilumatobacter sp.]|jgi:hypothetical protein|tara:strand:- start:303 stop:431 length:129 start_codon:yes stop_codon:yes gene_type:complete